MINNVINVCIYTGELMESSAFPPFIGENNKKSNHIINIVVKTPMEYKGLNADNELKLNFQTNRNLVTFAP